MSTDFSSTSSEKAVGGHGSDSPITRGRRSLFGPVDRSLSMDFLKSELEWQHQRDSYRWTFDFVAEEPLPPVGYRAYNWQPIMTNSTAVPTGDDRNLPLITDANSTDDHSITCTDSRSTNERKTQQTHITDFMRKRKFPSTRSPHDRKEKQPSAEDTEPSLTKAVRPSSA